MNMGSPLVENLNSLDNTQRRANNRLQRTALRTAAEPER